jgi:myo-inositol-1(or 4)-monophosphatase
MTIIDPHEMETLIARIRQIASRELMPRFMHVERQLKRDGSFVTEADLVVQQEMSTYLKRHWPDIPFLGEEMSPAEQRALLESENPIWCLDPLDGTTNFVADIPYFCISLSLIAGGRVLTGIVYDPNRDECFSARSGEGAWLNGSMIEPQQQRTSLTRATGMVDFKRLPEALSTRLVTSTPYASQRSFGSVALDLCWIAAGRCDLYLHGRSNIWDYGAGLLILHESGGSSCTLEGEEVFSRHLEPRSIVAAGEEQVFAEWCDWLGVTPRVR